MRGSRELGWRSLTAGSGYVFSEHAGADRCERGPRGVAFRTEQVPRVGMSGAETRWLMKCSGFNGSAVNASNWLMFLVAAVVSCAR